MKFLSTVLFILLALFDFPILIIAILSAISLALVTISQDEKKDQNQIYTKSDSFNYHNCLPNHVMVIRYVLCEETIL